MKAIITFVLFFLFLLIRSGNSHEVINHSDRPAISFMENHVLNISTQSKHDSQQSIFSQANSNGTGSHSNHILLEQESEDFQLWKDYHLQMAFYACLIAFTFLMLLPKNSVRRPNAYILNNNSNPIFISQRSLRI